MGSNSDLSISFEVIEKEQEEIEEALESLLIFPNQQGLRSAHKQVDAYFDHEETLLKSIKIGDEHKELFQSHRQSQQKILKLFRKEMNNKTLRDPAGDCCKSS